jgi:antitoxin HicB
MTESKDARTMTIEDYLAQPYERVLIPDREAGGYTALIKEFPGCVSEGESADEALKRLENAAFAWIEAALYLGQDIPTPTSSQAYSGKLALRMPRSLHQRIAEIANDSGVSINQWIVTTLSERVGAAQTFTFTAQWIKQGLSELVSPICDMITRSADHAASTYTRGANAIFDRTIETVDLLTSRVNFDQPEPVTSTRSYRDTHRLGGKFTFDSNQRLPEAKTDQQAAERAA